MGWPIEAFSLWRHGIGKVLGLIPMKSTFSQKFLHLGWPSNFTKRQNSLSKRSHNPECLPNLFCEVKATNVCHIQCSNIHPIWHIWLRHKILADRLVEHRNIFQPSGNPYFIQLLHHCSHFSGHSCLCLYTDCEGHWAIWPAALYLLLLFSILQVLLLPDLSPKHWKTRFPSKYLDVLRSC